jgi:hypothetical protein
MNTATIPMATTACRNCGQVFYYEPILVFGKDLAACIHQTCEGCEASEKRAAADAAAGLRRAETDGRIRAQIPPALLATDLNHPTFNSNLWRVVGQWRPNKEKYWLGVIGLAGKCKTRCLALLAMRVMRAGTRIVWTTANRLKDCSGDRNSREREVSSNAREHLADCLHAPWLFIDDFGKNEWSPAFESQLFQILDHRKNHLLPTVYTSNAHPEEFSQIISPLNASPIIGRLLDSTTILNLKA